MTLRSVVANREFEKERADIGSLIMYAMDADICADPLVIDLTKAAAVAWNRIAAALDYMDDSDPDDWREAMRNILSPVSTSTGEA